MGTTFTLPPDNRAVGTPDPANDMNAVIDALRASGLVVHNVLNAAYAGGADPSGATDSSNAFGSALAACPAGGVVFAPPVYWNGSAWAAANYVISSQLTIPGQVVLLGGFAGYRASSTAKLSAASLTTGSLITFATATPAGAIANFELDGTSLPGGVVDGIGCYTNCKQGTITGVEVHNFTQHGINITQNGGNPDGWLLQEITAHNNTQRGINWDYAVDGQLDIFHLDNNGDSGLGLGTLNNMSIGHGKCQQNTNYGYIGTGGFVKANSSMVNCLSENNGKDGWHLDFSAGGGQGSLSLIGCSARDDGTAGTSGSGWSGFNINPKSLDLTMLGCSAYVTTSTAGPDYGLTLAGVLSSASIIGGSYGGSVSGYHYGTGNTGTITKVAVAEWTGQADTKSATAFRSTTPGAILSSNSYAPGTLGSLAVTATTFAALSSGNVSTGSFLAPSSGKVMVRATFVAQINANASMAFALAAVGTVTPIVGNIWQFRDSSSTAQARVYSIDFIVSGLTPNTSYNFDLLAAAASADTVTVKAQGVSTTTPTLSAATDAGPVDLVVVAL